MGSNPIYCVFIGCLGRTTLVANLYASVSKWTKQWASTPMRFGVREFDSHLMQLYEPICKLMVKAALVELRSSEFAGSNPARFPRVHGDLRRGSIDPLLIFRNE